jgi:hypothetical protein
MSNDTAKTDVAGGCIDRMVNPEFVDGNTVGERFFGIVVARPHAETYRQQSGEISAILILASSTARSAFAS